MLHPRLVKLVDDILEATKDDRVNWKEAPKEADKELAPGVPFLAAYTKYSIVINAIDRPVLGVDNKDYVIDIVDNATSRALQRITAAEFGDAKGDSILGYAMMSEIFKLARWKALKIDDALAEITNGLTNPPQP